MRIDRLRLLLPILKNESRAWHRHRGVLQITNSGKNNRLSYDNFKEVTKKCVPSSQRFISIPHRTLERTKISFFSSVSEGCLLI